MSYLKTIDEIKNFSDTAIVPVGSLEQHGHHLPVSTDIIITQAMADAILARDYAAAEGLLAAEKYDEAIAAFTKLGAYGDSVGRIAEIQNAKQAALI